MLVAFKLILVIFVIGHVTLVILSYQHDKKGDGEEEDNIVFLILFFYFGIVAI